MKRINFILILSVLSIGVLQAQSNEMMDQFLLKDFAETGSTLLLIAQARGELGSDSTPDEALTWASKQKWGSHFSGSEAEDVIPSGKFYLALLESFSLKGGVMYKLFKTPRLAVREAVYQGVSTGIPYVNHTMAPLEVLTSLSTVLDQQEVSE